MRYHKTLGFTSACETVAQCLRIHDMEFDRDDSSSETASAIARVTDAIWEVIDYPAVTPAEIEAKISIIFEHEVYNHHDRSACDAFEALCEDARRLKAVPVSPQMLELLWRWRHLAEEHNRLSYSENDTNEAALERCNAVSWFFQAIMDCPCTTPGDFLAKAYLNILGELGSTFRIDGHVGNMFDINIDLADRPKDHSEAWQRAAYADLDASDLGANLLAYGLPEFSARHWMERAQAVGLGVHVMVQPHAATLWVEMPGDDISSPRNDREQERLRRILAFQAGRKDQLIAEIRQTWPQLVVTVPVPASLQAAAA